MTSSQRPAFRVHTFDPTKLTKEDSMILYFFLDCGVQYGTHAFSYVGTHGLPSPAYQILPDIFKSRNISAFDHIQLTHTVYFLPSAANPRGSFKVLDNQVTNNGVFGQVINIIGTLMPRKDGSLEYKKTEGLVTKLQSKVVLGSSSDIFRQTRVFQTQVEKERALTERDPTTRVKPLVYISVPDPTSKNMGKHFLYYFLTMRKLPGKDLSDYRNNKPVTELLKDSARLCLALEHVHRLNVIHQDVAPKNIRYLKGGQFRLFDFGLSRSSEAEAKHYFCGTELYAAPEVLDNVEQDKEADIFSLGITIATKIWGANLEWLTDKTTVKQVAHRYEFKGLFSGVPVITTKQMHDVKQILTTMVAAAPIDRSNLLALANQFEAIHLNIMLESVSDAAKQLALRKAFSEVTNLRSKILDFVYSHTIDPAHFKAFIDLLTTGLNKIPDEPDTIKLVVTILNIEDLANFTDKQSIFNYFDTMFNAFTNNKANIDQSLIKVETLLSNNQNHRSTHELNAIKRYIEHTLAQCNAPFLLDYIPALNTKLAKNHLKIEAQISGVETEMQARTSAALKLI